MSPFRFLSLVAATGGILAVGCASVSVKSTERLGRDAPKRIPEKIFVRPLEFHDPALRVDRDGAELERFKFELQEKLTRNLVRRLNERVAPAQAVAATAPLPVGNYWVVTGRFNRVYQGSRLLRMFIGLGTGGTKLDTEVVVQDLSVRPPRPFLRVETTGGSNVSPGTLGTAGFFVSGVTALGSVVNALEGFRSGLTFDTVRTSREITASMSEFLYQQGAISYEKALGPKRLGSLPYTWWPFKAKAEPLTGEVTVSPAN